MNTATRSRARASRQQRVVNYPKTRCTGTLTPPLNPSFKEVRNLANTNPDIRITEYRRDTLGHITEIIDALGNSEYYSYNLRGEVSEKTDRDGYVTTYSHTPLGDISSVIYSDGKCAHFEHNALRQLTQVSDWLGTTTLELDALGRTLSVTDHNSKTINYTWTALGQRESIVYPNGTKVTHHFDELERLIKITDGTTEVSYAYDTLSRPISKSFICGKKQTQSFNTLGQLASLKTFAGAELLDSLDISYDVLGNKTQITQQRQGLTELDGIYSFTHDALSRLVSVSKDKELLREYCFDAYGNRTEFKEGSVAVTSHFNALNQLISSSDSTGTETKNVFDKRGNQVEKYINDALVGKYTYGALNRLESTQNLSSNKQAKYHYSGLGHRVAKTIDDLEPTLPHANPIKHIEDTLDLTRQYNNLLERKEDGTSVSFIWDASILSASSTTGTDTYLLDYLGSPLRAGEEAFAFDEFGQTLAGNFDTQPFGYTGYQQDDITNTWFAQARQYDSATGRFGAEDVVKGSILAPQTQNPYTYCWNVPLAFVDLDGRTPKAAVVPAAAGLKVKTTVFGAAAGGLSGFLTTTIVGVTTGTFCWKDVAAATVGGAVGGAVTGATWAFLGPKGAGAAGGAAGYGTTTAVSGIWDFADGTTELNRTNVGALTINVGQSSALGTGMGYLTGPGGAKIVKNATPSTIAQINDGQFMQMLAQALPLFFAETSRGIAQHYLLEFLRDFNSTTLGIPDFSSMTLFERIWFGMNLNAELQRIEKSWTEFVQDLLCFR